MDSGINHKKRYSRRNFLKTGGAAVISGLGFPYIIRSIALGAGNIPSANGRIALAHIGVGGQGTGLMSGFLNLPDCQVVAVCDAFENRRKAASDMVNQAYAKSRGADYAANCATFADFRELLGCKEIDAVVIATPDHWHVPIALEAVRMGKDIYVEKPLGLSIEQNKILRQAVRRYGRVFQYGTQQRCFSSHCARACELVRDGAIGTIKEVHVVAPGGASGGSTQSIPVPDGLDYEMWLGPAMWSPYTQDRCTNGGSWYVYANSLGFVAGWGAHPLDIMHWGYPHIPVEYEGTGVIPQEGLFNTITQWKIKGRFESGVEFTFTDGSDKTTFVGDNGWISASRSGWDASDKKLFREKSGPQGVHLFQNVNHHQNFLDAVKKQIDPVSPIESAVQSDFVSHLSDIAIRLNRKIKWDPQSETIVGDAQAVRMADRALRSPWHL